MRVPSGGAAQHAFARVPAATIERSKFDRSHGHKTTMYEGFLVPIFLDEALPGDTFSMSMTGFARLATPLKPLMDNLYFETFFFAVPVRLVWNNWAKFNGEQEDPGDSTDYTIPQVVSPVGGYITSTLADHFGLPIGVAGLSHSALFGRAYNLIYNEWFRDQNLKASLVVDKDDGPDSEGDYQLQLRMKRHDYFTSCLPWPQKGDSVSLPLGTVAPVVATGDAPTLKGDFGGGGYSTPTHLFEVTGFDYPKLSAIGVTTQPLKWNDPELETDLSAATAATINELRQAFQVQKLLERDARGGTRYTEVIKSHFGVTSPDARLQRPEYLGGGSQPVVVSPVAQTSSTDVETPQGNLAAIGTVAWSGHGFSKSFTEHSIIMGIANVRGDLTYQQGLERMWSRSTRYDFYWPALSHIGEQAVLSKEIYCDGTAGDEDVFGYQERYAEYRYKPSKVTGVLRSNVNGGNTTLDFWHLAQDFAARPVLNTTFMRELAPMTRVLAVPSEPHFLVDMFFRLTCARPMPVYGVPGLIDHF